MSSLLRDPAQLQRATGWKRDVATSPTERGHLRSYIAFQMASAGLSPPDEETSADSMAAFSAGILESLKEKNRLLSEYRAPIDSRIEAFLNETPGQRSRRQTVATSQSVTDAGPSRNGP